MDYQDDTIMEHEANTKMTNLVPDDSFGIFYVLGVNSDRIRQLTNFWMNHYRTNK
jgi:hypothetical protein